MYMYFIDSPNLVRRAHPPTILNRGEVRFASNAEGLATSDKPNQVLTHVARAAAKPRRQFWWQFAALWPRFTMDSRIGSRNSNSVKFTHALANERIIISKFAINIKLKLNDSELKEVLLYKQRQI